MTTINNIIKLDKTNTQGAAVLLEDGLYDQNLVANFSPTHSSIDVLDKLSGAVLPGVTADQRAMNWFGSYGSGKSHLATLIGQLLRDGAHTVAFTEFLRKLDNYGKPKLVEKIKKSFLSPSDPDSKPYLIVPLYASQTPSLAAKLMEGLYKSLDRIVKTNPDFDIKDVLPKTEYDAARERFTEIIDSNPEYINTELSKWSIDENYYNTEELQVGLERHEPAALSDFSLWHQKICHGAIFQAKNSDGNNFIEAYEEAAKNLSKLGYGGIVILWDEFGNALEDLIRTPQRNPTSEIIQLQEFVENVCQPSLGHVIFIGMTHVSMAEYGSRSDAGQDIQDRLTTIEGRFTPIKIESKASESEGYHLLGVQTNWSDFGNELLIKSESMLNNCCSVWKTLPLFFQMSSELQFISKSCYPLHPITAAALFAISTRYAQATRTAFTFLRDMNVNVWSREINNSLLFNGELVRLPMLVEYYEESLGRNAVSEFEKYQRAIAEVQAKGTECKSKVDILKILFLSVLLKENFQATDLFLSISLHDSLPENTSKLFEELAWLQKAGLIWKNDMTGLWTLAGESGVDPDSLIEETIQSIPMESVEDMLRTYHVLKEDLLPMLGIHNIEPSDKGIIRSYSIEIMTAPFEPSKVMVQKQSFSAKVVLVFCRDFEVSEKMKVECRRTPSKDGQPMYFWISTLSSDLLLKGLRKYLAIFDLLKQKTHGEGLRRQLQAKWEKNRHEILYTLNEMFGRNGLESGKTQVILGGQEDPVSCKSWYEFKNILTTNVCSLYSKEIEVRSARINEMADENYNGRKIINDIIDRILDFDNNVSYQNNLLGYADTKQEAAIIDGLLGEYSNDLFIKRENGWDIKSVGDVKGNIEEILKLIKNELLRKREKPYNLIELRKKLLGVPFGLPASVHSILTAVAIRADIHRIEVAGGNQRDFSKQLGKAFVENTSLKIRVQDFNRKQTVLLRLLSDVLKVERISGQSDIESSKKTMSILREKVKNYPNNIRYSSKISVEARNLVSVLETVGQSTHDIVNDLMKLTPFNSEWGEKQESSLFIETIRAIESTFDEFEKLANERVFALKEVMKELVPEGINERDKLVNDLTTYNTDEAKQIAQWLAMGSEFTDAALKHIVNLFTGKSYDECSDIEIGQMTGKLRSLFEHVKVPTIVLEPPPQPYTPGGDNTTSPLIEPPSEDEMINNIVFNLNKIINTYKHNYNEDIIIAAVKDFYEKFNSKL